MIEWRNCCFRTNIKRRKERSIKATAAVIQNPQRWATMQTISLWHRHQFLVCIIMSFQEFVKRTTTSNAFQDEERSHRKRKRRKSETDEHKRRKSHDDERKRRKSQDDEHKIAQKKRKKHKKHRRHSSSSDWQQLCTRSRLLVIQWLNGVQVTLALI